MAPAAGPSDAINDVVVPPWSERNETTDAEVELLNCVISSAGVADVGFAVLAMTWTSIVSSAVAADVKNAPAVIPTLAMRKPVDVAPFGCKPLARSAAFAVIVK